MLHLSGMTITLGKSNNYWRIACLIHLFAIVVLFNSSFPMLLLMMMSIVWMVSMTVIARTKIPVPAFSKLSYHLNYWILHSKFGDQIRYKQARISFDAGLFFLLTLSREDSQKKLVIFNDQLTPDQYRALNVISKITSKKT